MANKVRTIVCQAQGDGTYYYEFAGPSTATKPVGSNICSGSLFHEVDTSAVYGYLEDVPAGDEWTLQMKLNGEE